MPKSRRTTRRSSSTTGISGRSPRLQTAWSERSRCQTKQRRLAWFACPGKTTSATERSRGSDAYQHASDLLALDLSDGLTVHANLAAIALQVDGEFLVGLEVKDGDALGILEHEIDRS